MGKNTKKLNRKTGNSRNNKRIRGVLIGLLIIACIVLAGHGENGDDGRRREAASKEHSNGEATVIETGIIVGFGGENGYEVFSTKDPAVIDEYINAFRDVRIEAEIKDKDKMIRVWDGIVDFTFKMDDETGITVGTDLVQYVTDYDRGIQFKLGNIDTIIDLNLSIRE